MPREIMFFPKEIIESLFMIAVITAGIVWHGVVLGRREDREAELWSSAKIESEKLPVAS